MRRPCRLILALTALLLLGAGATQASAGVGHLAPRGCVEDDDAAAGNACAQATRWLAVASGIAASPDGRFLYAVSSSDYALMILRRDPTSGAISPRSCIGTDSPYSGFDICTDATVPGLVNPEDVAVSPDGRSVYVASEGDLTMFRRVAGGLHYLGCFTAQRSEGCAKAAGVRDPSSLAVSPDGSSVYVAGLDADAVVRFERDRTTGMLTPSGCVSDDDTGTPRCAQHADGLDHANAVEVSPDGESVYALSGGGAGFTRGDSAIAIFDRAASGELTPRGCIDDETDGPDSCALTNPELTGPEGIAISPDGDSVYVGGDDHSIVAFDRDATGALSFVDCVHDSGSLPSPTCSTTASGLRNVSSLAASPDGRSVYSTSVYSALGHFRRNRATGALTPAGCIADPDAQTGPCAQVVDGLYYQTDLAISPQGDSLYVTTANDLTPGGAVVRFKRRH